MFLSALNPMLTLCEEAIALAKEGNVQVQRAKFDRVRMLQSLLTRAKNHNARRNSYRAQVPESLFTGDSGANTGCAVVKREQ